MLDMDKGQRWELSREHAAVSREGSSALLLRYQYHITQTQQILPLIGVSEHKIFALSTKLTQRGNFLRLLVLQPGIILHILCRSWQTSNIHADSISYTLI